MGRWRPLEGQSGQSSVEYAIVVFAFLAMFAALAALARAAGEGTLAELARQAASHSAEGFADIGFLQDVLAY